MRELEPGNADIKGKLEFIDSHLAKNRVVMDLTNEAIASDPKNFNAVIGQTEKAKILGMDELVKTNSRKMMDNPKFARKGAKNLIQLYELEADTAKLLETVNMAKQKGISEKELMKEIPNLRPMLIEAKKRN